MLLAAHAGIVVGLTTQVAASDIFFLGRLAHGSPPGEFVDGGFKDYKPAIRSRLRSHAYPYNINIMPADSTPHALIRDGRPGPLQHCALGNPPDHRIAPKRKQLPPPPVHPRCPVAHGNQDEIGSCAFIPGFFFFSESFYSVCYHLTVAGDYMHELISGIGRNSFHFLIVCWQVKFFARAFLVR